MSQSQELLKSLTPMDYSKRVDKVRNNFPEDIDALIVTHLTNVRYITGYTGSNGVAVITNDSLTFITDGRYIIQSKEELEQGKVDAEIFITQQGQGQMSYIEQILSPAMRVGLEASTLSWAQAQNYIKHFKDNTFVQTNNLVEQIRKIKEPAEVDRIRTACRIADDALEQSIPLLSSLPTEKEFAKALDRMMIDLGAEANSFETIVACGKRGALPHAVPTENKIEPNQMIVVDFGCMVDGYCSDMTRTLSVGEPDEKQKQMYDNVIEAQRLGRESVRDGIEVGSIDLACREYLVGVGMGQYFSHSTGHGVGLDIHEEPWVKTNGDDIAKAGHILTVEPGVYIEGIAGVRIEDTLCVSEDGAEVLTTAPKTLVVA